MHKSVIIIKNAFYIPAFLIALGMPGDMAYATAIYGGLGVIDVFTGILQNTTTHGRKSCKSIFAVAGLTTKLIVVLIPAVIALIGKGICIDMTWLVRVSIHALIVAEGISIIGNIQSFITKEDIPEFDAISLLLAQIRKFLIGVFSKFRIS